MEITGYKNKDGDKIMRESFCAYFDILGFSDKIKNNDLAYFNKYLTILQQEIKNFNSRREIGDGIIEFEYKIFTDNFVFGYPWDDDDGEDGLGTLFEILSRFQYNFILKDIFIRGGIDYSQLFMDENVVFGPALIEAYKLESEKALYPRIILSDKTTELLKLHISYYAGGSAYQEHEYLVDIDGFTFVNYLFYIIEMSMSEEVTNERLYIEKKVQGHRQAVIRNLVNYKNNFKVFNKFVWVGNYHNYFCNNFLDGYPDLDSKALLIPDDLINKSMGKL